LSLSPWRMRDFEIGPRTWILGYWKERKEKKRKEKKLYCVSAVITFQLQ
jgi:hypothetical protein